MSDKHNSFARKVMVGVTGFTLTFSAVSGVSAENIDQENINVEENIDAEGDTQSNDGTQVENGSEEVNDTDVTDGTEEDNDSDTTDGTEEGNDTEATDGTEEDNNSEATDGTEEGGDTEATDGTEEGNDSDTIDGDKEAEENIVYTDLQEKTSGMTQAYYEEIVEAVMALSGDDIIDGYEDGTFRALNSIKRAEVAKIIAETIDLEVTEETSSSFTDVNSSWAEKEGYLAAIQEAKIMEGFEGKFRPEDKITRAEFAATIVRAFDLKNETEFESTFTDIKELDEWAVDAITILEANELANGLGENKYAPENNLKRGDTAIFLHRILVDLAEAEAEFQLEIQTVEEQITALDPASESFSADIEAARVAYDALSEEQQAAITNLEVLEEAESTLELIEAVVITEEEGKAVLSTTKTVEGLNTEITLVDSEGNPVTFGTLFSRLVLTTTVGEEEAQEYDLYDAVKDLNTIPYGTEGGFTLTEGEDQITELASELNEAAEAGTYTLTTIVKKGDLVLEMFSSTIEIAEKDKAEENVTDDDATEGEIKENVAEDDRTEDENVEDSSKEDATN